MSLLFVHTKRLATVYSVCGIPTAAADTISHPNNYEFPKHNYHVYNGSSLSAINQHNGDVRKRGWRGNSHFYQKQHSNFTRKLQIK